MKTIAKVGIFSSSGLALALGVIALAHQPAHARPPGPDCGPTRLWNCVLPRCPDCPEILFEGTICEKTAFEKKTGRVCSPEGA